MEQMKDMNAGAQMELIDKTMPLEWNAEFTLPDYRSEISRLLWVRPQFSSAEHYLGNGKADFSGTVHYEVLYVGPDGALYSTNESCPYAFSVPLEAGEADLMGGVVPVVELLPDAIVSRVAAPRKLTVRCRLHARVRCYAACSLEARVGEHGGEVLRLCEPITVARVRTGTSDPISLQGSLSVEGEGELRVISARGNVFLAEVYAAADGVRCRGEAVLTALCCYEREGERDVPQSVTLRLPLDETLPMEGCAPDGGARATGRIAEVNATVEGDRILFAAEATIAAETRENEPVYYTKDLFLPGMRAECRFTEKRLCRAGVCRNRHFTVSGELPFAEVGLPAGALVVDAVAEAEPKEVGAEQGRAAITGELCCRVLYKLGAEYGVAEARLPFRHAEEGVTGRPEIECCVPMLRAVGEHERLRIEAELQLALRESGDCTVRTLSEASFSPAPALQRSDMELCYPAAGDTLWEIGKKYSVSPEAIAALNGRSAEEPGAVTSLSGAKFLLIP